MADFVCDPRQTTCPSGPAPAPQPAPSSQPAGPGFWSGLWGGVSHLGEALVKGALAQAPVESDWARWEREHGKERLEAAKKGELVTNPFQPAPQDVAKVDAKQCDDVVNKLCGAEGE